MIRTWLRKALLWVQNICMLYVTNTKPLCMLLLKTCKNFHTNSVQNKYAWKPEWVNDEKLFLVSPWFTTNGSAQRAALHVWFGRFFMYLFIWLNSGYPFWHKGICVSSWDWTTDLSFLKWKVQNWAKKKKDTHFFVHMYVFLFLGSVVLTSWNN